MPNYGHEKVVKISHESHEMSFPRVPADESCVILNIVRGSKGNATSPAHIMHNALLNCPSTDGVWVMCMCGIHNYSPFDIHIHYQIMAMKSQCSLQGTR